MIRFISPQEYHNYIPPANEQAQGVYNYIKPFIEHGSRALITNVDTEIWLAQVDDILLPITKNTTQYENSYVCSLFSHYISYCKEELDIVNIGFCKYAVMPLIKFLGWIMKSIKINKVVILNNFMLSTNLYVPISKEQYKELILAAKKIFPDFLIVFRSLNEDYNAHALADLLSLGGVKIASRRVYLLKPENIRTSARKLLRKDEKVKIEKEYYWEKATLNDIPNINKFYDTLYLNKYSRLNPQFTSMFYHNILQNSLFEVRMLKQKNINRGVCGVFVYGCDATAPIFGYDPNSNLQDALYRVLSLWGWDAIKEKRSININFSSGVSFFKSTRGAVGCTEYIVLFNKHLSVQKRIFWKIFSEFINKIVLPFIIWRKY